MSHRAAAGGDTSPCLIVVPTQTSYELEQPTKVRMKRESPLQGTLQRFMKLKNSVFQHGLQSCPASSLSSLLP